MAEGKATFDGLAIGLSQPAIRALHAAGIRRLAQLTAWPEEKIARLHGMGPKGVAALKAALTLEGLSFSSENPASRSNVNIDLPGKGE